MTHHWCEKTENRREERYIRVVISERGTGLVSTPCSISQDTEIQNNKNTRDDVAEADGGEGDEAEVEGVKEGPASVEPSHNDNQLIMSMPVLNPVTM